MEDPYLTAIMAVVSLFVGAAAYLYKKEQQSRDERIAETQASIDKLKDDLGALEDRQSERRADLFERLRECEKTVQAAGETYSKELRAAESQARDRYESLLRRTTEDCATKEDYFELRRQVNGLASSITQLTGWVIGGDGPPAPPPPQA